MRGRKGGAKRRHLSSKGTHDSIRGEGDTCPFWAKPPKIREVG